MINMINMIKLQLLKMKCVLNIQFQVVDRGSETQPQVVENVSVSLSPDHITFLGRLNQYLNIKIYICLVKN